jgi:hypothetical protein
MPPACALQGIGQALGAELTSFVPAIEAALGRRGFAAAAGPS